MQNCSGLELTLSDQKIPSVLYKRFSSEQYARNFLNGEIRFGSLKYFKELEAIYNNTSGDRYEGGRVSQADGAIVSIQDPKTGLWHPIKSSKGEFFHSLNNTENYFISCFSYELNEAQNMYGEYLVTIKNPIEFYARVNNKFKMPSHTFFKKIDYYDRNIVNEPFSQLDDLCFLKEKKFASDYEFRLMIGPIQNDSDEVRYYNIGSIEDIALLSLQNPR